MVLATVRLLANDVSRFMMLVGVMRLLLMMPFAIMTPRETYIGSLTSSKPSLPQDNLSMRYICAFGLLLGCTQCITITMYGVPNAYVLRGLLRSGYATRTIAFDLFIGVISALYGTYTGVIAFE